MPDKNYRLPQLRKLCLAALLTSAVTTPVLAQEQHRLYISGHSLTDRPMPDMVADIARHAGLDWEWNRQHIAGSSIRQRTLGEDSADPASGYRSGVDRDGGPVDVLMSAGSFDTFVITEWHRVLDALLGADMLPALRDFIERVTRANPEASIYFYAPWADVSDLAKPNAWIAYERAASPVWHCLAERANTSAESNRPIGFIPASKALADLVSWLIEAEDAAGFEGAKPSDITSILFTDRVHLTDLGVYFVALITFGTIVAHQEPGSTNTHPAGLLANAWLPDNLDPAQAKTLRAFAASYLSTSSNDIAPHACANISSAFVLTYQDYMHRVDTAAQGSSWKSAAKLARNTLKMLWQFNGWGSSPFTERPG